MLIVSKKNDAPCQNDTVQSRRQRSPINTCVSSTLDVSFAPAANSTFLMMRFKNDWVSKKEKLRREPEPEDNGNGTEYVLNLHANADVSG